MRLPTNAYNIIKNVSVEPAVFLSFITQLLLDIVNTNLYLQKACRYNTTIEPDLDIPCDDEKAGILFVSSINVKYRYIEVILVLLFITLLISWSDEAGRKRKILIIVPIIGMLVTSLNGCLHSFFWYWPPLFAALSNFCIQACSGGLICVILSAQAYLCDTSSVQDRTMRIGILTAVSTASFPIANGISGFMVRSLGFFNSYSLCFVLATISLISAVTLIKDISLPTDKKNSILSIFRCTLIVDSVKVTFKKSLGRKRIIVLLLHVANTAAWFSYQGELSVFYLFLRYKFKWDERMFSVYQAYKLCGVLMGTAFCSIILSKLLKIHDGIIGMFAGFWDVLAALAYIFAGQTWHLYLIPLLDIFHKTALTVGFSFMSKFYDENEFGRLNAVFALFNIGTGLCCPTYNMVFQRTLDFFPAAFFILSVIINTAVCVLFAAAYVLTKKIEAQELIATHDKASSVGTLPACDEATKEIKTNVSNLE